jgi:hypothetical protein
MHKSQHKKKFHEKINNMSPSKDNSTRKVLSDTEEKEMTNNEFKDTLTRIINEIEENMYKQLNEFKEDRNKY